MRTIENVADIFLDEKKKTILEQYDPLEQVQIVVCGYNSVGKSSFIHELLNCGEFLPVDKGPITALIVKFSHTIPENACFLRYTSIEDRTEIERTDLSMCFDSNGNVKNHRKLRKNIKEQLERKMDVHPNEFEQWAKNFIEIRLPSKILEPGLCIYDTPGFLRSDAPILRENLLKLVESIHPIIVHLYDNPTGSDDSRKCYNELKVALRNQDMDVDIFFLNTKADVAVMRKDAKNNNNNNNNINKDDDDEDIDDEKELIYKEPSHRYDLLMKIDEMKDDVHERYVDESVRSFEQCESCDIFSTLSPQDSMEIEITSHAIHRIISFAVKHDFGLTKNVIEIVHAAIDTFFDFVLVTNRCSLDEWAKLREEALKWGDQFFEQYRSNVDTIRDTANRCLPQRYSEKRSDIKSKAMADFETRRIRLGETFDSVSRGTPLSYLRVWTHMFESISHTNRIYRSDEQIFIDILVEREVTKPVLRNIIAEKSKTIQQIMSKDDLLYRKNNELRYAAKRDMLWDIGNLGDVNQFGIGKTILKTITYCLVLPFLPLLYTSLLPFYAAEYFAFRRNHEKTLKDAYEHRRRNIDHYLIDLEGVMNKIGDHIKETMSKWIDQKHDDYKKKVNGYYRVACRTIQDRQKAYKLARSFASKFVLIECQLEANLHLATHDGSTPCINHEKELDRGGFFNIYEASWDNEHELVAKKLQ